MVFNERVEKRVTHGETTMKVTLDQITANEHFMYFWNSVYGEAFADVILPTRNAFMEVAYMGFVAGQHHERTK